MRAPKYDLTREEVISALKSRHAAVKQEHQKSDYWYGFTVALEIAVEHLNRGKI